MTAFRAVCPEKACEAGSSWRYASVSTIGPPTPSTSSVQPISCSAATTGSSGQIERRDHCGCHDSSPAAERWIRPKPSMWEADTSTPRSAISASSAVRVARASSASESKA